MNKMLKNYVKLINELEWFIGSVNGLINDLKSGYIDEEDEMDWKSRIMNLREKLDDIIKNNK